VAPSAIAAAGAARPTACRLRLTNQQICSGPPMR
jgi:hypothetical protein